MQKNALAQKQVSKKIQQTCPLKNSFVIKKDNSHYIQDKSNPHPFIIPELWKIYNISELTYQILQNIKDIILALTRYNKPELEKSFQKHSPLHLQFEDFN